MPKSLKDDLPNAHFGKLNRKPMDWTKHHEKDVDDEELEHTPKDVTGMLGFDPKTTFKKVKKAKK